VVYFVADSQAADGCDSQPFMLAGIGRLRIAGQDSLNLVCGGANFANIASHNPALK
jgi:hypothetical protein